MTSKIALVDVSVKTDDLIRALIEYRPEMICVMNTDSIFHFSEYLRRIISKKLPDGYNPTFGIVDFNDPWQTNYKLALVALYDNGRKFPVTSTKEERKFFVYEVKCVADEATEPVFEWQP